MSDNKEEFEEINKILNNNEFTKEDTPMKNRNNMHIIIIFLIVFIVIAIYFLYERFFYNIDDYAENYNKNEEYYSTEKIDFQKEFNEKYRDNINIERIFDNYGNYSVLLTNNNNVDISELELYILYYDGNNSIIQIENYYIDNLLANGKSLVEFYDVPKDYEKYEFFIKKRNYGEYSSVNLTKNIEYSSREEENYIKISCKNNTDKKLEEIVFLIIYYDENNNIIYAENSFGFDIKKGKEVEIKKYKQVESNRYEIFIEDIYVKD